MGVLFHNLNPTLQLQERLPGNLYRVRQPPVRDLYRSYGVDGSQKPTDFPVFVLQRILENILNSVKSSKFALSGRRGRF